VEEVLAEIAAAAKKAGRVTAKVAGAAVARAGKDKRCGICVTGSQASFSGGLLSQL